MAADPDLAARLVAAWDEDELPPLSAAKEEVVAGRRPGRFGIWGVEDRPVVVAVVAPYPEHDAVEVAVAPEVRPWVEPAAIERAESLVGDRSWTVWAHRAAQRAALEARGYRPLRGVVRMRRSLPAPPPEPPPGIVLDSRRPGIDDAEIVAVNARAFADHREQGTLDVAEFRRRTAGSPPAAIVVAREGDELVGFCWTTRPAAEVGEIHVVATDPPRQGRGLGRALVLEGLRRLSDAGCRRAVLWTDAANEPARRLYRRLGFLVDAENVEYRPPGGVQPNR